MCGISGIFNRNGSLVDLDLLVQMTRTLVHRGPDEEGYFINAEKPEGWKAGGSDVRLNTLNRASDGQQANGNVGLGHRRLSIVDLATGQQPLCNEDGSIWIAFNGEIYNFQTLMSELQSKGHSFRTKSDTETIVHAYEEWGEKALERLRGMFAFALWDENRQRLLLARDRVGKKPLYYLKDNGRFIFGSEIKAILECPNLNQDIDLTALSDYLSLLYIPSPKTIFKSICKLPAAHYMIVTENSCQIRPYWDISFYPNHKISEQQMMEELIDILDEATQIRRISEVPLGAFLSGGIDSSSVVALMANAGSAPVITNSISFSVSKYDESRYAKQVAKLFSTDHHEFHVTPETIPIVEKLSWHYDEPFADSSAVPTYYVSKTARENVTVALSGDGGDENFAGYRRYYFDLRENFVRNLVPEGMCRSTFGFLGKLYPQADYLPQIFRGKAFISNVARDPVEAYFFSVSANYEDDKRLLLNQDVKDELKDYSTSLLFHEIYNRANANDHLSRLQYLDIKTYLCEDILTKVDRASMAVSLEVRCPILDHVFMEYVAKIPSNLKLCGREGKYIFKKALRKYLPDNILYRQKMGFAIPINEWLRKDLRTYASKLVLGGEASRLYLDTGYLKKIWKEHQSGMRNHSSILWGVMMLNLWYKRFILRELR